MCIRLLLSQSDIYSHNPEQPSLNHLVYYLSQWAYPYIPKLTMV
jgi:hypothetical protein